MRALAQVVLAAAELDDDFLLALAVALHGRGDLAATEQRRADLDLIALAHQQHLVEFDIGADIGCQLLDAQNGAFADAILLTTRGNDGVHDLTELRGPGDARLKRA